MTRSPYAQKIFEEAMAGPGPSRGRAWHRDDEPQTEAEAERWFAAHPDDPGPTPEAESRAEFENAGADRLYDEPGDPLEREPMNGNPRWKDGV